MPENSLALVKVPNETLFSRALLRAFERESRQFPVRTDTG